LLKTRLIGLGLEVYEDGAGAAIGGDTGNLLARWPGDPEVPPVLFSAHLDRVANPGRIVPVVKEAEDLIASDGTTILGADDASGLAAILDGIRRVQEEGARHGDVELALTVAEEVGLQGSLYLDYSKLKAKVGYVLDTGGPVGVVVNQAPTQMTVKIAIHGKSAHAGMAPEEGLSAIRLGAQALTSLREGRLSPISTSNFGIIKGGVATNIVCDLVKIEGEARSHDPGELAAYVAEVAAAFKGLENRGAKVEMGWEEEYRAFDVPQGDPVVAIAKKALAAIGREPTVVRGGGGLDANRFNKEGIRTVGLSTGYDQIHSDRETQSISALVDAGRVVAAIIKEMVALA
jgi:tripeptide aminopeptidase